MSCKDAIGTRMKLNYELRAQTALLRRIPVIIRVDGKAFHTFTKGLNKPYDTILMDSMQDTMLRLCKNIQGCKFGYTQSDEITLVLTDYDTLTTDAWFGYETQKMCSISASMATLYFNDIFAKLTTDWLENYYEAWNHNEKDAKYADALCLKENLAMFDSRCFNVPKEEVCNCLIWRQQDATKNAVQLLAREYFSHKEVQGKSGDTLQEMLWSEKGINFSDERNDFKRGAACYKTDSGWIIDKNIPIFTQDRDFAEKWV